MAWELLPVDYTDASWSGLKRYNEINNADGTVSFQDVTLYTGKEKSFFGAKDANRMNEALNTIMSMVNNGTDLYEAFQAYFNTQKALFENEYRTYLDTMQAEGDAELEKIKTDYKNEIQTFETQQEALFNQWFDFIKGQLGTDVAGNLQNQINTKLDVSKVANNLTTTEAGYALDARQGKILNDNVSQLGGFTPIIDDTGKITGYKTTAGADTVFPFNSTKDWKLLSTKSMSLKGDTTDRRFRFDFSDVPGYKEMTVFNFRIAQTSFYGYGYQTAASITFKDIDYYDNNTGMLVYKPFSVNTNLLDNRATMVVECWG